MKITIALDAMGGDHGPSVVVPAALAVHREHPNLELILVGQEGPILTQFEAANATPNERLVIHPASQVVGMDEPPSQALRSKKDSSMRVAINLVKDGRAQAAVSAGNSGALMATARFVLKTLPGVDRPAMISTLPTINKHVRMLDLGANVDSSAEQLLQFAVMGSVLTSAVDGNDRPRVGLLNIGEEAIKGNEQVKEAARILSEIDLNYIGFVEGDDIYRGKADVVVCDGFVGNVALKTSEGVARMVLHYTRKAFGKNPLTQCLGLLVKPILRQVVHRIDPSRYNGASLVGLQGIVLKSHGSADAVSFATAIRAATLEVQYNVPARIGKHIESFLSNAPAVNSERASS